jgi:hypothetical protein
MIHQQKQKYVCDQYCDCRLATCVPPQAFNKKVASVSGGIELMNAAGFEFVSEETSDEMVLVYPMLDRPQEDLLCCIQQLERLCATNK